MRNRAERAGPYCAPPMPSTTESTASAVSAETLNLPNPRHAKRLPAHIGKEQFGRIRNAAFGLPQVVKPGDFVPEGSSGFEEHLDKLGYVLLQKATAGARPSRWIAPELMDAALAHLDAVGSGPGVRASWVRACSRWLR